MGFVNNPFNMKKSFGNDYGDNPAGAMSYGIGDRNTSFNPADLFSPAGEMRGMDTVYNAQQRLNDLTARQRFDDATEISQPGSTRFTRWDDQHNRLQNRYNIERAQQALADARGYAAQEQAIRDRYPEYGQNARAQALGYTSAAAMREADSGRSQQNSLLQALMSGLAGIFNSPSQAGPLAGLMDTALSIRDNANNPIGGFLSQTRPASNRYGAAS